MKTISRTNIYIVEPLWTNFRIACLRLGTSASKEIRRMIEQRLTELEPQPEQKKPAPVKKARGSAA